MGAARAQVSNDAAVLRALWSWNRTPASGNSMQCMGFPPRSVAGVELGHRQRCCEAARPQKLPVGSSASLATGHWNPQHLFQKLAVLTLPSSHSGKDLARIQRPLTARPGPLGTRMFSEIPTDRAPFLLRNASKNAHQTPVTRSHMRYTRTSQRSRAQTREPFLSSEPVPWQRVKTYRHFS